MSVSVEKISEKLGLRKISTRQRGPCREHAENVSLSTDFLIIIIVKQTNFGFVKSEVKDT